MPIVIKDPKWHQTQNTVTIRVPLHGAPKSSIDTLTTEQYLKASFEKFFFEAFLLHPIITERSKCTIADTEIIYDLVKTSDGQWEKLERDFTNKQEKMDVKRAALDSLELKLKEEGEKVTAMKNKLKRCAVTEAVGLDTKQRNAIDKIRNEEKIEALGVLQLKRPPVLRITEKPVQAVPLTRKSQTLTIDFTPRVLPTPIRESKIAEEEEYLAKQAEAQRSVGFHSDDLRAEEKNPHFLLAKGDEFMNVKNYLGAVSAFSFGIKIAPRFIDLFVQRSEAHFRLGNFYKCVQDCSSAMDLMKPELEINLLQRSICIGRRGASLYQLGLKKEAIDELRVSLSMRRDEEFERILRSILDEQ